MINNDYPKVFKKDIAIEKIHMKQLKIVLPTLNEEKAIIKVIKSIPIEALKELGYHTSIIVIDGHSKDKTVKLAKKQGAEVITQKGKGKGKAIRTAFIKLKKENPDIAVMLDADNTYNPKDIPKMILPLIINEADVTIGSRDNKSHFIGNAILTSMANKVFKGTITDLCTGYWAFNNKAIRQIDIKANGFDLETDLFAQVNKNKLKMKSVDIKYRRRIGKSKLKKADGLVIIGRMIRNIRDWNPMILFGLTGLISFITSLIFGIRVIIDYTQNGYIVAVGTFILTVFLAIIGVFMMGMGLILDLLERRT